MRLVGFGVFVFLGSALSLLAADPKISHDALSCVAKNKNARITAKIEGQPETARVYFHAIGAACGDYYVDMHQSTTDPSAYWAVLPIGAEEAKALAYQIRATAPGGREISGEEITVPIDADCPDQPLSPDEAKAAANMTIGLTANGQTEVPCAFKCIGITNLLTANLQLLPHEACRLLLAQATGAGLLGSHPGAVMAGALAAAGGGVAIYESQHRTSPSPVRP
ncbi:MAG TPA: hypothetical protein VEZ11_16135 [Thermoanaerobaculia bacterium]|nr:hypothetical protein [Thermoanaerobaculia bacterium]